jgi:hypothetical protein
MQCRGRTGPLTALARPQPRFSRRAELVIGRTESVPKATKRLGRGALPHRGRAPWEPALSYSRDKYSRKLGKRNPTTEWCCRCQRFRDPEDFLPLQPEFSYCRSCRSEIRKEWRERNPDAVAAYNESRRIGPRQCECVDRGASFTAASAGLPVSAVAGVGERASSSSAESFAAR